MKLAFIFLAALSVCGFAVADSVQTFRGLVVREGGKPVAGAPVVLYENFARRWTWFPKSDREIARTMTNKKGEFIISTSDATADKRLMLVAKSEWKKFEMSPGENKVVSKDGMLLEVSKNGINTIVVPSYYVPATRP